jgi:hypothetical protein
MLRWRNQSAGKAGRHAGGRQTGCGRAVVEPMEGRVLMSAGPFPDGTSNTIVFAERYASPSAIKYTAPDTYQIISAGRTRTGGVVLAGHECLVFFVG